MQNGTGGATDAASRCNRLRPFMSRNPRFFGHETALWHGLRAFASEGKPATWHFLDEKSSASAGWRGKSPDPCQNAVSWPKNEPSGRTRRSGTRRDALRCAAWRRAKQRNRSGKRTRKPESAAALPPTERQANAALPRPRPRHQAKRAPSPQVRRRIARGDSSSANPPSPHADAFPRRAGAYPHRTPARAIPNAPSTHTRSQGAQPSTCGGGVPPRPTRRAKRRKRAKDGS